MCFQFNHQVVIFDKQSQKKCEYFVAIIGLIEVSICIFGS